ncbi:aminopeptidase [bacterium]|nr:aminopeptidase [Akkermansiaceae bacterium]MDA7936159.1 aminopeptidase [bacterium]MDA7863908.1 aminopeptidase [Akkermansiaceae bacterium]MDB0056267.1 aminopeptidase [Akkermansiaceae bacterium]MDB4143699.1 aminopeptidase [Akkermansiaceae bacterium]
MDPRFTELAKQLVRYSTALKKDEKILLDIVDVPEDMAIALIREVRAKKGIPFVRTGTNRISRELLIGATDEQYKLTAKHLMTEMKDMDAYIAIRGSHNITETSDVASDKMATAMKHLRKVLDHRVKKTKWCVLRWPHPAMAQQAGMSTEAFEDFYFDVCLLDYKSYIPAMNNLKKLMNQTDQVHIKNKGTDLRFSIKDIPAVISGGNYNIPDGEVFTSPVKDSVEGVITHNAPTIYRGIAFDGIKLTFKKGKIIEAEDAGGKTKELNEILDTDAGARYVGEFALGFNPLILEPMRDILFDEKIAGSFHFTPGQAYEEADNGNRSGVHWDMVTIQRPDYGGGEIFFDGKLIRKNGKFLPKNIAKLNG